MVLLNSKLPKSVYVELIDFCYANKVPLTLTPSPSKDLKCSQNNNIDLLKKITFITANEIEAKDIAEVDSLSEAVQKLSLLAKDI